MELEGVTSETLVNVTPRLTKNRANFRRIKTNSIQSVKRWEKENELLYAMIEDECEWLSKLFPDIIITPEFFFYALEDGTVLCRLANYIQEAAQLWGEEHGVKVPGKKLRYNSVSKKRGMKESQLFRSRENVQMFLSWCRSQNISEAILFESNDVVEVEEGREGSREVVICLMEIARRAVKYDLDEVPQLIQLEKEIDAEEELDAQNTQTPDNEQGQVLNVEEVNAESEEETELEEPRGQEHDEQEQDSEQESIRTPSSTGGGSDSGVELVIEDCNGLSNSPQIINLPEKPGKDHEGTKTPKPKSRKVKNGKAHESSVRKKDVGTSLKETKTPKSELDKQICKIAESYNIQIVHRLKEGKYIILGRVMFVRMLNGHLLVRIGGGWDTLEHYIMTHVPKGSDGVSSSAQSPPANTRDKESDKLVDKSKTPLRGTPSAGCRASAPILGDTGSPVIFRETPGRKRSFLGNDDEKDLTEAIKKLSSSVEQNLATVGLSRITSKSLLNLKNKFDIRRGSGPEGNRRATSLENLTPVRHTASARKFSANLALFNNNNNNKAKGRMEDFGDTEAINGVPLSEDQAPYVNNGFPDEHHDDQTSFDAKYVTQIESRTVTETSETSESTDGDIVTQTTTVTKTEFTSNVDADQSQQLLDFGYNNDVRDAGVEDREEVAQDEFMTFTSAEQNENAPEEVEQTEPEEREQYEIEEPGTKTEPELEPEHKPEEEMEEQKLQHEEFESKEPEATSEPENDDEEPEGFFARESPPPEVPLAEPEKESYEMDPLVYAVESDLKVRQSGEALEEPKALPEEDKGFQPEEAAASEEEGVRTSPEETQEEEGIGETQQQLRPEDEQIEISPSGEEFQHTESETYQSEQFEETAPGPAEEVPIESVLAPEESIPIESDGNSKPAVEVPESLEVSTAPEEEPEHAGEIMPDEPRADGGFKPTEEARLLAESLIKLAEEETPQQAEDTPQPAEELLQQAEDEAPQALEEVPQRPEETPQSEEETYQPVEEFLQQAEESPEPVEEIPQPLEETPRPVEETPKTIEDISPQPVEEISKPSEDVAQPLEEIPQQQPAEEPIDKLSQPSEEQREAASEGVEDIPLPSREPHVEASVPEEAPEPPVQKVLTEDVSEAADVTAVAEVARPKTLPTTTKKATKGKAETRPAGGGIKSPTKSPVKSPAKSPTKEPGKKAMTKPSGVKGATKPAASTSTKKEAPKKIPATKTGAARPSSAKPGDKGVAAPKNTSAASKPKVPPTGGKDIAARKPTPKPTGAAARPTSAAGKQKPTAGKEASEPAKKPPGRTSAPSSGKARPSTAKATSKPGNEITQKPAAERPGSAKPHMTVAKKTVTKTLITKSGTGPSKVQKTTTQEKVETKNGTKTTTVTTKTTATGQAPKSSTTVKTTRPPSATKKAIDSKPGTKLGVKTSAPTSRDKKPATGNGPAKPKPGSAARPTKAPSKKPGQGTKEAKQDPSVKKKSEEAKDKTPTQFESGPPIESDVMSSSVTTKQVTETVVVNGQATSTVTTTETTLEGGEETTLVTSETIEGNLLEI